MSFSQIWTCNSPPSILQEENATQTSHIMMNSLQASKRQVQHELPQKNLMDRYSAANTLRPIQNGRYFADDIFKCIFLNKNLWFPIKISLKFVRKCLTNNIPALVQIKAWRRPGDKPLSEPMLVSLPTHVCVARPQWVLRNICTVGWIKV